MNRIALQGCPNTRDLGGIKTIDGKLIKANKLIRSGGLHRAFGNDMEILTKQYDVKTIVDFRTSDEIARHPDPEVEGVSYYKNPIIPEITDAKSEVKSANPIQEILDRAAQIPDDAEGFMVKCYEELVKEDYCQKQYRAFFDLLLKQENGAVLWHCSEGKDRTGMGAVFVLAALGVPMETIKEDYLYSNVCNYDEIGMIIGTISRLVSNRVTEQKVVHMMTVSEKYWNSAVGYIEREYGDIMTYLQKAIGLRQDEIMKLREKYLEA